MLATYRGRRLGEAGAGRKPPWPRHERHSSRPRTPPDTYQYSADPLETVETAWSQDVLRIKGLTYL